MPLKTRIKAALLAVLATALLWTAPVQAAGTTPLALAIQRDSLGNDAPGCLLYFYVAGTVATPQNSYSDFGLTAAQANPLPCDQAGRVPMHWLADGLIHIRLTTSSGSPIVDTTMQVLGPSSGGGGGGSTVDPTTIMGTGDLKARYGTGVQAGFVRANGLTVGNATSGASERANADTQALFIYLYNSDPNLAVSGGRTGNALNDYNSSKQLTLPDWRGRALAFLDDMGNTAAGRLTAGNFGATPTTLGAGGGFETVTMAVGNLIQHTHNNTLTDPGHVHAENLPQFGAGSTWNNMTGSSNTASTFVGPNTAAATTGISINNVAAGSASPTPMRTVQPTMLGTIYLKL